MVEKIRYHRQRDEDPMMVFLTNTDAWQGDSLINLYAVWSGIDILVINMATESKIQLWTSKGLMKTLGYEPGHFGRNAEKGSSYQPDVALYQMQWNYWCRVSLATALNATLGPAGNLVPFNKGKVSAPPYEGSGQWRSVWVKFIATTTFALNVNDSPPLVPPVSIRSSAAVVLATNNCTGTK